MEKLHIIKIGGKVIDDTNALSEFLLGFATLEGKKILVHGGGKLADKWANQLNIPIEMIEGRRVTDEATLELITMVYGGLINKKIVAGLQQHGANAMGLTGGGQTAILSFQKSVQYVTIWTLGGQVTQLK